MVTTTLTPLGNIRLVHADQVISSGINESFKCLAYDDMAIKELVQVLA
jgi:hypothetical protein